MKSLATYTLLSMLGSRLGLSLGNRIRRSMRTRRGATGKATRRTGRKRRNKRGNINSLVANANSIGGFKRISNTGPLRPLVVDIYHTLAVNVVASQDEKYYTGDYVFWDGYSYSLQLDMVEQLNKDQEFLDWRQYSSAFCVQSATINFNYCRMPRDGEYFPKLMLSPETDVVDFVPDPKSERNTMVLDMTTTGNKNYNVKFKRGNQFTQDLGWQPSSSGWTGTYKIALSSVEPVTIKTSSEQAAEPIKIAVIHATFRVMFRTIDQAHDWSKEKGGVVHPISTKNKRMYLEKMFLEYANNTEYKTRLDVLTDKLKQVPTKNNKLPPIREDDEEFSELSASLAKIDINH
jgi:hypothetical protein